MNKEYIPLTRDSLENYFLKHMMISKGQPITMKEMGYLVGLTVFEPSSKNPDETRSWTIGNISVSIACEFLIESIAGSGYLMGGTFYEVKLYRNGSNPPEALILVDKSL